MDRAQAQPRHIIGIDGIRRDIKDERDLNRMVAEVIGGPNGEVFLQWLRSVTIERVSGPEFSDCALRHLEGQRFLVAMIESRRAKGVLNE